MKSYVWLSFAFMGWAYYEVSGGGEFEPQQRQVAVVEPQEVIQPDVITRADTPTLLSVSTSNLAAPALPPVVEEAVEEVVDTAALAAALDALEGTTTEVAFEPDAPEPTLDLRSVAGARVNMRMGPSTDYDVITTLTGGTALEVLEINAEGWAKVSTVDRGIEGWMAERLLTDPQT